MPLELLMSTYYKQPNKHSPENILEVTELISVLATAVMAQDSLGRLSFPSPETNVIKQDAQSLLSN